MEGRTGRTAFAALVVGALVLGAIAAAKGELEIYLFLIIPVLRADGAWGLATILMALAAFIMLMVTLRYQIAFEDEDRKVTGGGVLLIGPVPIVFGTDRRTTILVLLLAVVVLATLVLLLLL